MAEQLQASRKQMEADAEDFDLFQEQLVRDRNMHLMFKNLYADPDLEKRLREKRRKQSDYNQKVEAIALSNRIRRQTLEDIRRPFRKFVFLGLLGILCGAALSDMMVETPRGWHIALYLATAAWIASTAYLEQRALDHLARKGSSMPQQGLGLKDAPDRKLRRRK
eukprot:TRINITY_DN7278_c0_g1_i12.p1 TRINITY_DN7278_c0_g1~~TRINITY_DN7278_c0_g1_i12.p1  ORF type:complete len:165 (+),score=23.99 TRINITY_DN7278_c0_g1_i12:207-701(+)